MTTGTSKTQKSAQANFKPEQLYLTGQKRKIVEWIRDNGGITPVDAWNEIHCTKLATRIGEIERRSGYSFNREKVKSGDTSFMRYSFPRGLTAIHFLLPEDCVVAEALMRADS